MASSVVTLVLCGACGADSGGGPHVPTSISVSPAIAASGSGSATTFKATDDAGAAPAVTWRVNGIAGGSAQLGSVSATGVYTAPAVIPEGDSVVVSAVLAADATLQGSATVFFIPDKTSRDYYVSIPRVIDATHPAPTRFLLVPPATATTVRFLPVSGQAITLSPIGAGVLSFTLDAAKATAGYTAGRLHNFVGRLDYRTESGASVKLASLGVNVRDAGMPDVQITPLAPDAQKSPYILNLRVDTATVAPNGAIVTRALQLLGGDRVDFIAVIATVTTNSNRFYAGVRNEIRGIGTPVFDNGAQWGSAPGARLRGVIAFPIDDLFDGAEAGMIHEIGHAWINHATDAVLGAGAPHWPPSTMALGVMGFSIPGTGAGGAFPWSLTSLGNGTASVARATPSDWYTPLDLYLIGLLPPDSVPPVQVLTAATNPSTLADGIVVPATTYTMADYVAAMGPRVPSSASAQRDFTAACVVLTYGRLMTASEMAYFDAACARAETRTPLVSTTGLVTVPASGFYIATQGRATLTTRLP